MIARKPPFKLETVPLSWTSPPEVGHWWNAASVPTAQVESYLNRVMLLVRARLGENAATLRGEIEVFVQQEGTHLRFHRVFNDRLFAAGLDNLRVLEDLVGADFRAMLKNRSLAFNAAYCAGFENFTMYTAKFFYERGLDLLDGADRTGADFMLWHLAEEFEHRGVAHAAFGAVSGNYFVRLAGLTHAFRHLNAIIGKALEILMEAERAQLDDAGRTASIAREKRFMRRMMRYTLPRMALIFLPFYNPVWFRTPRPVQTALDRFTASA